MNEDHLDPDRHLYGPEPSEDDCIRNEHGMEVLAEFDCKNWGEFYRRLYKGSDCGVSVGVVFAGPDQTIYCDRLYDFGPEEWPIEVHISSIVEGVDQETETIVVDLLPDNPMDRIYAACDEIEKQAQEIWDATHGCDKCAELIEKELGFGPLDGENHVHPDCPECGGQGIVI